MKTLHLVLALALLILAPIAPGVERDFAAGRWFRAALAIDDEREVPFFLWLPDSDAKPAVIRNGAEEIEVLFERAGGRIVLDFPHYDSRIEADAGPDQILHGEWRKTREDGVAVMPFSARRIDRPGEFLRFNTTLIRRDRPRPLDMPATRWKIEFAESGPAIGRFTPVFGQPGAVHVVHGTIETTTGDYRFLEGVETIIGPDGRGLTLSVFDGAHAFLIVGDADPAGERMIGDFYSGNWFHEAFTAERLADDDPYILPDPFSEVALTTGDGRLRIPALDSPRYRGRPVIVQIFGTWCPNCHDETPALVDLHRRYSNAGLEVLGLAYEVTGDDDRSRRQVGRFIERYNIPWEIVIAGTSDKDQASSTLPDISRVKSFPTTIWIGRDGVVRAIHSGFAGPATGAEHTRLLAEFDRLTRGIVEAP